MIFERLSRIQICSRVAHEQWNALVNTLVTSVIADQNQFDSLPASQMEDLARRLTAVGVLSSLTRVQRCRCLFIRLMQSAYCDGIYCLGLARFIASLHGKCPAKR